MVKKVTLMEWITDAARAGYHYYINEKGKDKAKVFYLLTGGKRHITINIHIH